MLPESEEKKHKPSIPHKEGIDDVEAQHWQRPLGHIPGTDISSTRMAYWLGWFTDWLMDSDLGDGAPSMVHGGDSSGPGPAGGGGGGSAPYS